MRASIAARTSEDVALLRALGISENLICDFEMVGACRVRECRGGLYEPDPGGRWAFITPICAHYPQTPESERPDRGPIFGGVVDLVAWSERAPENWLLRVGSAAWLGSIAPQYMDPEPIPLWRSPVSWLRNGCVGLVVLARARIEAFQVLSRCVGDLIPEDEELAERVIAALDQPFRRPNVIANRGLRHAA
jgi:hypothetical protein